MIKEIKEFKIVNEVYLYLLKKRKPLAMSLDEFHNYRTGSCGKNVVLADIDTQKYQPLLKLIAKKDKEKQKISDELDDLKENLYFMVVDTYL